MTRSGRAADVRPRCERCGKQCLTKAEAHHAVRFLNSHQQSDHHPVHAYRCGTWWHTGHVPQAKRNPTKSTTRGRRRCSSPEPRVLTPHDQLPPELQ